MSGRNGYCGEVDTVPFGCWRRETFDRYGLFDEQLIRNQDDEHNFRIRLGGGRVWQDPRIRFHYMPRQTLRALFRQYMQYGYWKVYILRKHGRPAALRHLVPGAFVATLGTLLLAAPFLASARIGLLALLTAFVLH